MSRPIVALIYDFDKTLSPKDMQEYSFLPGIRVEPDRFWGLCQDFALDHQMDGVLTYMYLMKKMAQGELDLSREKLRELGRAVEFFPGVETWFDRINRIGEENGVPEMVDCSVVSASYRVGAGHRGMIGVIGPTRMPYERVISTLGAISEALSELLGE